MKKLNKVRKKRYHEMLLKLNKIEKKTQVINVQFTFKLKIKNESISIQ